MDATLRCWQVGLSSLVLSILFLLSHQWWGMEQTLFAFGVLFLFGFAMSITIGMMYKIVPFLIWFHRFSSLVGKVKVPLLKDILPDSLARRQGKTFVLTGLVVLAGIGSGQDWVFRAGGVLMVVTSVFLFLNLTIAIRSKPNL